MNKKLAICIPTYNRCDELKRQLEFFLNEIEDHKDDVDLYISDNKSVDGTIEYLEKKQKDYPWINVIINEENNGLVGNLYRLLHKSGKSEFIWFVSDDDIFNKGVVKEISNAINNIHNLGGIFINSELWINNGLNEVVRDVDIIINSENSGLRTDSDIAIYELFQKKNTILMWISAWVVKRGAVEEIERLNFKNLHLTEPFLFAANTINFGSLFITPKVYLKNGTKLTSTWVVNELQVFKVHFIGFFRSILLMKKVGYNKLSINSFIKERINHLLVSNPRYFLWTFRYSKILMLKLITNINFFSTLNILFKVIFVFLKKIYSKISN